MRKRARLFIQLKKNYGIVRDDVDGECGTA